MDVTRVLGRGRYLAAAAVGVMLLVDAGVVPVAEAIPAFSRRYEASCTMCHQYTYPRLNSFGRRFRENGYQMPDGAEDQVRGRRMIEPGTPKERLSVFKELPLSMRGQVFTVVRPETESETDPYVDNSVFSYLIGGGTVAEDVSYFFTWTPFPDPSVHQARVGLHNIASDTLGDGTLNVRAGALFLLDFQRPGHRFLSAGPSSATSVAVGQNRFTFDETSLGVQVYGRPGWGPFHYELAVVSGDPGDEGLERDAWKDVFARLSYIVNYNSDREVRLGGFGYLGRSEMVQDLGGVELAQRDDFWMAGGDLEVDVGRVNLSGMAYYGHHGDPTPEGGAVGFVAGRGEALVSLAENWIASARFELVKSDDLPSLDRLELAPNITYQIATNVLASLVWRQDFEDSHESSGVLVLDASF